MITPRHQSRPRVVFVSQPFDLLYPPALSSIPIVTTRLATEVAGHGFEPIVLAPSKIAGTVGAVLDGVHYHYLSERGSGLTNRLAARASRLLHQGPLPSHATAFYELHYSVSAALAARRLQASIVHVHNFTGFLPVFRRLNPRAKLVLHMHCEWLGQLDRQLIRRRLELADLVVGCSEHVTHLAVSRFPEISHRFVTLENGVDTDDFAPGDSESPDADREILFVGRVSPEKGIHDLIDAFVPLAREMPDLKLTIVGPEGSAPREYMVDVSGDRHVRRLVRFYDEERRSGVSYAGQLATRVPVDLQSRVTFAGSVSRSELPTRYRRAAVVVNPSLTEAFGMSLAESMACGIPVVATRAGGMPDIVDDGSTGLIVEPGDPMQLSSALRRLLEDRSLRHRLGNEGRRRAAQRFAWPSLGLQLATRYRALLGEAAVSTPASSSR